MGSGPEDLDALRKVLAARIQAEGRSAVARELGLNAGSLNRFVTGKGELYAKTRSRVLEWWSRQRPFSARVISPAVAEALDAMLGSVPPDRRPAVQAELVATLRGLYDAHRDHCPPWIVELVEQEPGAGE
jgi:AcrR family transcriptional regulator